MKMNTELKAKLDKKLNGRVYQNSTITEAWDKGDFAEAQNQAASHASWGLWAQIGEACGLPHSDADREAWVEAWKARRASRFSK